jgi:hypothetical protein
LDCSTNGSITSSVGFPIASFRTAISGGACSAFLSPTIFLEKWMTFQVFGNDHIFIRVWRIIDHADCEVAFRLNHLLPCRGEVADFARAVIAVCASRIPGNAYRAVFFRIQKIFLPYLSMQRILYDDILDALRDGCVYDIVVGHVVSSIR